MPHLILLSTTPSACKYSLLCKTSDFVSIRDEIVCTILNISDGLNSREFEIPILDTDQCISYFVNNRKYDFYVPSKTGHINILYTSCNDKYQQNVWDTIQLQHTCKSYHLAIGGGDQIYMDDVWKLPCLAEWRGMRTNKKLSAKVSDAMVAEITAFYKQKYEEKWFSSPEYVDVLPQIPSINMWDDHDIIDGYGSYPDNVQQCDIVRFLYKVARDAFFIYQRHACPNELNQNLTNFFEINNSLIVNIDTRTERSCKSILSNDTHERILNEIHNSNAHTVVILLSTAVAFYDLKKLSTISSYLPNIPIPQIVNNVPGLSALYNLFGLPKYNDDICDGWCDASHSTETDTFMLKLLRIQKSGKNVVILVGDVHIGADAYVEKDNIRIYQHISSGVGSITTSGFFNAMKQLNGTRISDGIKYVLNKNSVIFNYNWASLKLHDKNYTYQHHHV